MRNYRYVDVPERLPKHKRIVMPQIGADDYPDRPAGRFLSGFWDESRDGPLYQRIHEHREEEWLETARAYEDSPRSFGAAWRYVAAHPAFYKFRKMDDETPLSQIIQERNLERADAWWQRIDFHVGSWCVLGHSCRDDGDECQHERADVCWMEAGEWGWPMPKDPQDHPDQPQHGLHAYHDYRLDVYGESYESCTIQLAYLVWKHYGNDRRACHEMRNL